MGSLSFLKRALPFFATFALGLFVASFFVTIGGTRMGHDRQRWHREMWDMRIENEQLREENKDLREQIDSILHKSEFSDDVDGARCCVVPPPTTFNAPDVTQPVPLTPLATRPVKPHSVYVK
jgi:hypothetical protein